MDQSIAINSVAFVIILISVFILVLSLRRIGNIFKESKGFKMPDEMPLSGVDVPILGTFGGIKGIKFLVISENTLNQRLTLYEDYMEYRVLVSKNADFSQIKNVQTGSFFIFHYLNIIIDDRTLSLGVRFANKEIMQEVADFLYSWGVPVNGQQL